MTMESVEDLRQRYREPSSGAVDKVVATLDEHCAAFLAKSPFMVLSTADADGRCDGSPKGGEPGFARVLDERHLAWADLSGNNRLDSFQNIVANASVACLFLIPGMEETLRVNGTARLETDADLCREFAVSGRPAKVVVVVEVTEAYVHCAKAFRRSALWEPETWPLEQDRPSAACMLRDHIGLEIEAELVEAALEQDTVATLWETGNS